MKYLDEQKVNRTLERIGLLPKKATDDLSLHVVLPVKPRSRKPAETVNLYITVGELLHLVAQLREEAGAKASAAWRAESEAREKQTSLTAVIAALRLCNSALKTISESSDGVVKAYANEILEKTSNVGV